jgi:pimeloyl-ACP methyl ester carboxylesterase
MNLSAVTPTDRFVTLDGVKFHYLDWRGTGQVLLFLPGFGDSAHMFDILASRFTDRFRAFGLTRRGHADSEMTPGGHDVDTHVQDILRFLDAFQVDAAIVIGHSMAGAEMTHLAAGFPRRVSKLIYLDAAFDFSAERYIREMDPLAALGPPKGYQESMEAYLAYLRPGYSAVWSPLFEADVCRQITRNPDGSVQDRMPKAIQEAISNGLFAYRPEYPKIETPALAFFAFPEPRERPGFVPLGVWSNWQEFQANQYVPFVRQEIDKFANEMHHATIVEMPETHHYCFLHKEDEVAKRMHAFLLDPNQTPFRVDG